MKTLSKHITYILLLCCGFFLTPVNGYACSNKTNATEQKSCSKDLSEKAGKKDCCKTKSCKKDSKHKNCNGKCEHTSCRCSTSLSSVTLSAPLDLKTINCFAETNKQKINFKQAYYSSGYAFIWQPPKIS